MKTIIATISLLVILSGCSDFLDRTPIDFPTEKTFYKDINGLEGGIIGAYDALQENGQYGARFMNLMEVRGDNVQDDNSGAAGGVHYQIGVFNETPSNTNLSEAWLSIFETIYRCNLVLQSVDNVKLNELERDRIVGQASFIRALCYFNAVRLWGKVPIITKVQTVEEARNNKRSEISAVYTQIINDLTAAKKLPASWPDAQRGRATSYAAQALLAKVYLYQKQYNEALSELETVVSAINTGTVISLVPMDKTFPNDLKTSKDILFAVQYLKGGVGESVHQNSRYRNNDNIAVITLPQSDFESNADVRKKLVAPTGSGQRPGKFNAPATNNETSSDFPVIRCAEAMLMYAEVLTATSVNPTQKAVDALNAVRKNAGLENKLLSDFSTKDNLIKEIYHERRLELALECDRWFDIVRTGQFKTIFPLVDSYRVIYPIPQAEIENVNDKTDWQNEGHIK